MENLTPDLKINPSDLRHQFSYALWEAIKEREDLRIFLKNTALEKFDNDYDVLVALIKDKIVSEKGDTFEELLNSYLHDTTLSRILIENPLITIFIPTLPSGFSPEKWDPKTESPNVVHLTKDLNSKSHLIKSNSTAEEISQGIVPGFPVVIVKDNERVLYNPSSTSQFAKSEQKLDDINYFFADEVFNPKFNPELNTNIERSGGTPFQLHKTVDAYNHGLEWQRDHIYYNLKPGVTKGPIDNSHVETINYFKFENRLGLSAISNSPGDPEPFDNMVQKGWTDGHFEFRISIMVNSITGVGTTILKVFQVEPEKIFNISYSTYSKNNKTYYKIERVTPLPYNPNIKIDTWDLQKYGISWKFIITEFDQSTVITDKIIEEYSAAVNFGFDASFGETVKQGFKLGITNAQKRQNEYIIVTTIDSDVLGEIVVNFEDDILNKIESVPNRGGTGFTNHYTWQYFSSGTVMIGLAPTPR